MPLFVAVLVGIALSCGDISEEEMVCEEAVARLETCCPEIDPRRINCVYAQSCNTELVPVLTAKASACLSEASCGDLKSRGTCERMSELALEPYQFQSRAAIEAEACR